METKRFQKKKEDFVCDHCGLSIVGSGYTDHCPKCLWSKHVDVNPGDRLSDCYGLMEPINIELKAKNYLICYQCQKCGYTHKSRLIEGDDFDTVLKLQKSIIEKITKSNL